MELIDHARRAIREGGIGAVAGKGGRYARDRMSSAIARSRLRAAARDVQTKEQAVELVFSFDVAGVSIKPYQWRPEITALLGELEERRPKTILEIGTCTGGSLFLFTRAAADDALLASIDLVHGQFGGGYTPAREPLYRSFARDRQRIELVRADSHDPRTRDRVQALFGGGQLDFLFIDGDHRYEGVKQDFELYSPLVAESGLIGFHDIVPGPEANVGGVPRFWGEVKQGREAREIVADWDQGSGGIGLITKQALA
jgi:predicted O-methyltransferase YrrM